MLGFEIWASAEGHLVSFLSLTAVEKTSTTGWPCYMAYVDDRSDGVSIKNSKETLMEKSCKNIKGNVLNRC